MKFASKTVVVTGGNSGIGRTIVHRFAAEGAAVALIGRDAEKGSRVEAEVAERYSVPCKFYQVDLSSESQVAAMTGEISERFTSIDIVVNNAGIGARRSSAYQATTPGARWDEIRGCNLDAAYFVSAYALPLMPANSGAAIVNISSTATLHGNWGLYCVAKAGVEALTRSFASEAAPAGIRVNCISPGWISINPEEDAAAAGNSDGQWEMQPSLLNRMGTTEEIADAVVFLASDQASFITGQTLIVDGGMSIIDYPSIPTLDEIGQRLMSRHRPD